MIQHIKNKIRVLHADPHMREVGRDTLLAFILKFFGSGLAFGFNVAVARLLGADGAGLYFLALAVTTIASVIGRVGLDNSLLRFVATRATQEDWAGVKGVYALGMRMAVVASGVVTLLMFLAAPWMATALFKKPELAEPLRWMSLSILPFTLLNLHAESLKGLKRIQDAMVVQGVGVPLISLLLIYPLTQVKGVIGVALAYTVATIMLAMLGGWAWHQAIAKYNIKSASFPVKELLKSCKPMFATSLINRALLPWMPLFLFGMWASSVEVGVFGAALRVAMLVNFMLTAINNVLAPKFAELYIKGDMKVLGATARSSALIILLLSTPIFLVLFFLSEDVMRIYGNEFEQGALAMVILAVGQFVNMAAGSVGMLLMMSGNEKVFTWINILAFVLQVMLLRLLAPAYGVIGASIATSVSVIVVNVIASFMVFRLLGLIVTPLVIWVPKR